MQRQVRHEVQLDACGSRRDSVTFRYVSVPSYPLLAAARAGFLFPPVIQLGSHPEHRIKSEGASSWWVGTASVERPLLAGKATLKKRGRVTLKMSFFSSSGKRGLGVFAVGVKLNQIMKRIILSVLIVLAASAVNFAWKLIESPARGAANAQMLNDDLASYALAKFTSGNGVEGAIFFISALLLLAVWITAFKQPKEPK